jgi:ACT domain-containing protein
MLMRRLLVRLPDRPGSLGQVTTLLGRLGVDIWQMRVLERDGTSATDEFAVAVPGDVVERTLPSLIEDIEGVSVISWWTIDDKDHGRLPRAIVSR